MTRDHDDDDGSHDTVDVDLMFLVCVPVCLQVTRVASEQRCLVVML